MKHISRKLQWTTGAVTALGALLLSTPAKAETLLSDFDNNFFFDGEYGGWYPVTGGATNWSITASNFGGAFVGFYAEDGFTPTNVNVSADDLLELTVTLLETNATMGPQVLLEDADGTRLRYGSTPPTWYGLSAGTYTLTAELSAGVIDLGTATGSVAGLDLSNLALFHIQTDPGGDPDPYTIILENLRTLPFPPPPCESLVSDFDNAGLTGGYAAWAGPGLPPAQPDNWTVTSTGFGGGWTGITPHIDASGETLVELAITVTNTPGSIIPIVVFQDGDGTQETWPWGSLTNGSYLLAQPLSAGNPVPEQPGTVPGLDTSNLAFFHLQVDPGTNTFTYTATFENLRIFGFNPTIVDFALDPNASQFELTWNSRPGRTYSVWYESDLTGSFSLLASNILSGGTSTTNTVVVPAGDTGYLQVSEECQ